MELNFKAIIKGWFNYLFISKEIEIEAKRRANICQGCMHKKTMKYEIVKDHKIKSLSGHCCELCGCPLSALLRQKEKHCDAKKW